MNKTLSVNIGGIVFHIEEQAYDRLTRYLDAIKINFTTSDGRDEIMQDIEARLGEMFEERISGGKQVIVESDVDFVINIMGKPEQFAEAADENDMVNKQSTYGDRRTYRKLYRDDDDRIIGGVCAGFSHYIGIDPIWLRLAFAVAFFAFGSGLIVYLVLMFIMPKAITTSEKLEMKGEKVNISNIRRSVEEELGTINKNFENSGAKSSISGFFDALGQLLTGFFKLLGKLIAALFIIVGVIILGSFVMALFALIGIGSATVPFFITDMMLEPWQQSFALIGGFLLIGVPLIMIIYNAIRVLFKVRSTTKVVNWTAFALWVVGLGMCITVGTSVGSDFKMSNVNRTNLNIVQPESDTLKIGILNPIDSRYDWYLSNNNNIRMPWSVSDNSDSLRIVDVRLDIVQATGTEFEVEQMVSSRGSNRKDAYENAAAVVYNFNQQNNQINFDESFTIAKGNKFRAQKIQLVLKVPVGKSVFMSNEIEDIIYDIKNVTNTYDGYMVGHTWTMTQDGLECLNCDLPGRKSRMKSKGDDFRISINEHGVSVNGIDDSDSSFEIDENNLDIKINDKGVHINAREK